jgi:hypothetical protein
LQTCLSADAAGPCADCDVVAHGIVSAVDGGVQAVNIVSPGQ